MSERARVLSTEALKEAKAALAEFAEAVSIALSAVDSDVNKMTSWLQNDRPAHWQRQVRLRHERVEKAKAEIAKKQLTAAPEPASVVFERKALKRRQDELEAAKGRLAAVKRWAPVWEKQAQLYKGACRQLTEALARDIPAATLRIERMLDSLEEYHRLSAPRGEEDGSSPPAAREATE